MRRLWEEAGGDATLAPGRSPSLEIAFSLASCLVNKAIRDDLGEGLAAAVAGAGSSSAFFLTAGASSSSSSSLVFFFAAASSSGFFLAAVSSLVLL